MQTIEESKGGLLDLLHTCLMCNSLAYEVRKNEYECSNDSCGFIWRVIDSNE